MIAVTPFERAIHHGKGGPGSLWGAARLRYLSGIRFRFSTDGRFREPPARHEDDDYECERRELEREHLVGEPQELAVQVPHRVYQQEREDTPVRVVVDPDENERVQDDTWLPPPQPGIVAGVRVVAREEDERGVLGAQRAPVDDAGDERAASILQPVEVVAAESDLLDGGEQQAECQHGPECRRVGQDRLDDGDRSVGDAQRDCNSGGDEIEDRSRYGDDDPPLHGGPPHVDEPSTQVIDPFLAAGEPGHRETGEQRTRPTEEKQDQVGPFPDGRVRAEDGSRTGTPR